MPEESVFFVYSNSLRRFAPRPSYPRVTVLFFLSPTRTTFVSLVPLACKGDSFSSCFLSLTPPLSLEEVAFMPEESDFLYIRTPSPFRALPLIQE